MANWVTVFRSVRRWWHRDGPFHGPPATVFSLERAVSRVPPEYLSLHTYLERRYASIVVLTFEQMEALLGFVLPASARTEREWWTAGRGLTNRYSEAWMAAGRTAVPNLPARTVTFERLS